MRFWRNIKLFTDKPKKRKKSLHINNYYNYSSYYNYFLRKFFYLRNFYQILFLFISISIIYTSFEKCSSGKSGGKKLIISRYSLTPYWSTSLMNHQHHKDWQREHPIESSRWRLLHTVLDVLWEKKIKRNLAVLNYQVWELPRLPGLRGKLSTTLSNPVWVKAKKNRSSENEFQKLSSTLNTRREICTVLKINNIQMLEEKTPFSIQSKFFGGFICILPGLFVFFIPWTLLVFKERATSEPRYTVNVPIDRFCFNKILFAKGGNYLESLQKKKKKKCRRFNQTNATQYILTFSCQVVSSSQKVCSIFHLHYLCHERKLWKSWNQTTTFLLLGLQQDKEIVKGLNQTAISNRLIDGWVNFFFTTNKMKSDYL